MLYTLRFFSSKCSLFHNANLFGSCIIHILYTGCAKIKKNDSGAKRLTNGGLPTWGPPQGRNTNIYPFLGPAKGAKNVRLHTSTKTAHDCLG